MVGGVQLRQRGRVLRLSGRLQQLRVQRRLQLREEVSLARAGTAAHGRQRPRGAPAGSPGRRAGLRRIAALTARSLQAARHGDGEGGGGAVSCGVPEAAGQAPGACASG